MTSFNYEVLIIHPGFSSVKLHSSDLFKFSLLGVIDLLNCLCSIRLVHIVKNIHKEGPSFKHNLARVPIRGYLQYT